MYIDTFRCAHEEADHVFQRLLPHSGLAVRKDQVRLCHVMLDNLLRNTISLCDAGVGIGKTYAYLVAGILARKYALGISRPIVVSTSSVALQEAIVREYIPFLSQILLDNSLLDQPLSACVRKGKERFVCDQRLSRRLAAIAEKKKNAGQYAALRSLRLHYDLDMVASLSDFDRRQVCVPKVCPRDCIGRNTCRYHQYLRRVQSETIAIQICNHNYLLADAAHRQEGLHPLLLRYGALIVDEAHKLPEAAGQMYGEQLSVQDFEELATLLEKERCIRTAERIRQAGELLFSAFRAEASPCREDRRLAFSLSAGRKAALKTGCTLIAQAKEQLTGRSSRWLITRLAKIEWLLRMFSAEDSRYILYLQYDCDGAPTLCAACRDTPRFLRRALWEQGIPAILTSGTLKAGDSFLYAMQSLGLERTRSVQTLSVPSPFDYQKNCRLYFPTGWEKAAKGSKAEIGQIAGEILRLVEATCGHTLVLFTSYALMGAVYNQLKGEMPFPLLEMWRNSQDTVRRFKREQNAVLFAAGSCWEGMDFPGDMVSSLIIPRLPFPVPDPVREAQREKYMTLQEYIQAVIVPEMQVKLRQGFGRAIRTETDSCVVAILDPRAMPGGKYHQEVLSALPPIPMTRQIEDVRQFIRARKGPDYFFADRRKIR